MGTKYPFSYRQKEVEISKKWISNSSSGIILGISGVGKSNFFQFLKDNFYRRNEQPKSHKFLVPAYELFHSKSNKEQKSYNRQSLKNILKQTEDISGSISNLTLAYKELSLALNREDKLNTSHLTEIAKALRDLHDINKSLQEYKKILIIIFSVALYEQLFIIIKSLVLRLPYCLQRLTHRDHRGKVDSEYERRDWIHSYNTFGELS